MQLIVYISRLCFLFHKGQDFLQLLLGACLKSRRIVEDKSGVTPEYERPMDVMYPSLNERVRHTSISSIVSGVPPK